MSELFKDRKEIILSYINHPEYVPLKRKEMSLLMEVPKSDMDVFDGILDELVKEGNVIETKKKKIMSLAQANMGKGTFLAHPKGYGFISREDGEDIFIPTSEVAGAMQRDTVLYKIINPAGAGKKADGIVIKILERGVSRVVGLYQPGKSFGFVVADDKKMAKDIFIAKKYTMGAVAGHKVVVEIIDYGENKKNPEGKIVEILGHINDPGVDILSIIRKHELAVEFPQEVYAEIENIPEEVLEADKANRVDLRDTLTITIDGEDAKDLDDAVTLEKLSNGNYKLGVHIADVSHYVHEHTELNNEGYRRGTSVYLVDRVIPMLPHKLSNGLCSLNPNVDRLTMSCIMEIDGSGTVVDQQICESIINSNYRMTYSKVRELIEDKTPELVEANKEIIPMLMEMNELRMILGEKRKKRGAINFDLPESKIILDEKGKPIEIHPYERSIATNLIEEFMLVANETVAETAFWQEIPFVYRNHAEPDDAKMEKMEQFIRGFHYYLKKKDGEIHPRELQRVLQDVEGKEEERVITRVLLRSMMQARYSGDNVGHFGLAAKYYSHFTSPIRRYPDLQSHRMLKKMLHGEFNEAVAGEYRDIVAEVSAHCSKRERIAEEAERDTVQLKKVEYMSKHVGEVFEGIIAGVTGFGLFVELPNTVEGMIALADLNDDYYEFDEKKMLVAGKRKGKIYALGDHVEVYVAKVSKELGTIDFMFEN
ncbi:ribonuclease R [Chakrabartyella piscis]|uniref:ribonuclease R n=1 Tax=Chakrabartyella piscis TaxID=2918914 RepID=UPI0029589820|nr:ribonuclease R [Chakrabartyella piscis]